MKKALDDPYDAHAPFNHHNLGLIWLFLLVLGQGVCGEDMLIDFQCLEIDGCVVCFNPLDFKLDTCHI